MRLIPQIENVPIQKEKFFKILKWNKIYRLSEQKLGTKNI